MPVNFRSRVDVRYLHTFVYLYPIADQASQQSGKWRADFRAANGKQSFPGSGDVADLL